MVETDQSFNLHDNILVDGVKHYKCVNCGEVTFVPQQLDVLAGYRIAQRQLFQPGKSIKALPNEKCPNCGYEMGLSEDLLLFRNMKQGYKLIKTEHNKCLRCEEVNYTSQQMDLLEKAMNAKGAEYYTYKIFYSPEDEAFIGTVEEFPSLSAIESSQVEAFYSIVDLVQSVLEDINPEDPPLPYAVRL